MAWAYTSSILEVSVSTPWKLNRKNMAESLRISKQFSSSNKETMRFKYYSHFILKLITCNNNDTYQNVFATSTKCSVQLINDRIFCKKMQTTHSLISSKTINIILCMILNFLEKQSQRLYNNRFQLCGKSTSFFVTFEQSTRWKDIIILYNDQKIELTH